VLLSSWVSSLQSVPSREKTKVVAVCCPRNLRHLLESCIGSSSIIDERQPSDTHAEEYRSPVPALCRKPRRVRLAGAPPSAPRQGPEPLCHAMTWVGPPRSTRSRSILIVTRTLVAEKREERRADTLSWELPPLPPCAAALYKSFCSSGYR
jgi:hypothetical protein